MKIFVIHVDGSIT